MALANHALATDAVRRLVGARFIRRLRVTQGDGSCLQITPAGLESIGSDLPVPSLDPSQVRRELTVGWLWVGAHLGKFGSVSEFLTRRQLIARGESADIDLLLPHPSGRVAVRILLSTPPHGEVERLLRLCARDPAVERVRFMVRDSRLKAWVLSAAADLDLFEMISAHPLT